MVSYQVFKHFELVFVPGLHGPKRGYRRLKPQYSVLHVFDSGQRNGDEQRRVFQDDDQWYRPRRKFDERRHNGRGDTDFFNNGPGRRILDGQRKRDHNSIYNGVE